MMDGMNGAKPEFRGDTQPPSAADVEKFAREYQELQLKILGIAKKAQEDIAPLAIRLGHLKIWFVANVGKFGSAHYEKSKILHGIGLEAMATFGQSSSIDNAAVETFRLALYKAKQARVLKRIFEKTVRWKLLPQASAFLRGEHEAGKFPDKLFLLFARCTVTKEKTPVLEIRPKNARPDNDLHAKTA